MLLPVASTSLDGRPTRAQSPALSPIVTKREVSLVGKPGTLDVLTKVPAASAFVSVVSDTAGVLAVAHAPQPTVTKAMPGDYEITNDPDVTLYRLDAKGELGATTSIRLPRAPKLAARRHYPLALAAHPKLPLLYVWQDVIVSGEASPAKPDPTDDFAGDGFRHLHVYDLSSPEPRLVQSALGGESFSRGNYAAALAFDRNAGRLFLPNLQRRIKTGFATAIGYIKLRDDGKLVDDSPAAEPDAAKVSLYGESPCGLGFLNLSDTRTIVCAGLGPATWDEANRRGQLSVMTFFPTVGGGYRYRMVQHPTLPVLFLTGLGGNYVFRVEHVDGFMTMFPQRGLLPDAVLTSPPVIVGKRPFVACYSLGVLHLLGFDAEGYFNGERTDIPLSTRKVEALAYSAKYDRLYVTHEEAKK